MEEAYVSFEVAKLLKQKGFVWKTDFVWYEHLPLSISSDWRNKVNQKAMDYFYFNETTEHHSYYGNNDKKPSYVNGDIYSAPTQQMACRWLREEYDIDIIPIIRHSLKYAQESPFRDYACRVYDSDGNIVMSATKWYSRYENAIEAALDYALKNLI